MVTQRVGRQIIKTIYDNPQSRERFASSSGNKLKVTCFPSEMFLENTNNLQEWLGKKPCCPHKI